MYTLGHMRENGWLPISGDDSMESPDEFVALVKAYQLQLGGKIIVVTPEDTRYAITNDPLKLVFQWDSLFGITVIVPPETEISAAEESMYHLCEALNKAK